MIKISTFDDWVDYFRQWQKDIGYDPALLGDYKFETKLGELHSPRGRIWRFQRATEMATCRANSQSIDPRRFDESDRLPGRYGVRLGRTAKKPARHRADGIRPQALTRVNSEEMRHGWQMCYLLVNYFGDSGKLEARKMLERRAFRGDRLLGSFNAPVNNWLDFFTYTEFVDRDGKYQLTMLSHSAFAPLAESVTAMLKEEFFHMFTGHTGLTRIMEQEKFLFRSCRSISTNGSPPPMICFGTDHSSSAHWAYTWGSKDDTTSTKRPCRRRKKASTISRAHIIWAKAPSLSIN